ncbi:MAG: hypothetical protein ACXWWQ_03115 [Candidatus Limnocylindria bacterium]
MSREERRQYERMMRNMERGQTLPPAARARVERNAARRAARRSETEERGPFAVRFWVRTVLVAVAVGFLALSLQWGEGLPAALYVGLIAGAFALAVQIGLRLLQRRAARRA